MILIAINNNMEITQLIEAFSKPSKRFNGWLNTTKRAVEFIKVCLNTNYLIIKAAGIQFSYAFIHAIKVLKIPHKTVQKHLK